MSINPVQAKPPSTSPPTTKGPFTELPLLRVTGWFAFSSPSTNKKIRSTSMIMEISCHFPSTSGVLVCT